MQGLELNLGSLKRARERKLILRSKRPAGWPKAMQSEPRYQLSQNGDPFGSPFSLQLARHSPEAA
jgi:hypothetical protein